MITRSPWDSNPPYFEPPPHTYQSTDELLPLEDERLFQLSPPPSLGPRSGRKPWQREGWQFGALLCAAMVTAVLILNVAITAWAACTFGLFGGIGTIHRGPCPSIKRTGLWLHIAINVLSTMLLGASNYSMQFLSSPTRSEVNRAHQNKTWLDIGIQSLRNLTKIRRMRMVLWFLLAASSIPLHLM